MSLTASLIGFAQFARQRGLNVGVEETLAALRAAELGVWRDPAVFYYSLRSLFCTGKDDLPVFDRLYRIYWQSEHDDAAGRGKVTVENNSRQRQPENPMLAVWGRGKSQDERELDSKTVTGAHAVARLRRTDFSRVGEMDAAELDALAQRLWREMLQRLRRRRRQQARRGQVDLRRTIRASLEQGGDPVRRRFRAKRPKKLRLVVLLDVSGSMDKYSFFLLRFVWALQSYFEHVESFTFSTRLRRITALLEAGGLEQTLRQLSAQSDNWSSGTRIGECLAEFNERHAKHLLARSACVIVLSDGLDTGEPGHVAAELERLRRRCKRLIWLNPLRGMPGYAPTARGMHEAMPWLTAFESAHNLESLLELETLLGSV